MKKSTKKKITRKTLEQKIEDIMCGSTCLSFEPSVCSACEKRAKKIIKAIRT